MTIIPSPPKKVKYPGFRQGGIFSYLPWKIPEKILFPLCVGALLLAYPMRSLAAEDLQEKPSQEVIERCAGKMLPEPPPCMGDMVEPPPCKGEIAAPPPPPEPPPCSGIVAPPPCRGRISLPPDIPQAPYRILSLEDYAENARQYVGMPVRLSGTLGKTDKGKLVGEGYYIFKGTPRSDGQLAGCPLVGSIKGLSEGSTVVVEGRVVQQHGGDSNQGTSGTYYALSIDRIFLQE